MNFIKFYKHIFLKNFDIIKIVKYEWTTTWRDFIT